MPPIFGLGQPVALQQPGEIGEAFLLLARCEPVGLVEHNDRHGVVVGHCGDIVVVEASVGILLWVRDPHKDVDEFEHALGLGPVGALPGVEVGQVEQDEAVERSARADLVAVIASVAPPIFSFIISISSGPPGTI